MRASTAERRLSARAAGSRTVIAVLLASACLPTLLHADDIRGRLPLPASTVFERMLASASQGAYDKTRLAMGLVSPLILHVENATDEPLSARLEQAIAQHDQEALLRATRQLIVRSVQSLLNETQQAAGDRAQLTPKLKDAYAEYLVLDAYIQQIDFDASRRLRGTFRQANALAGVKPAEFTALCQSMTAQLDRLFQPVSSTNGMGENVSAP